MVEQDFEASMKEAEEEITAATKPPEGAEQKAKSA
jgi:hypothetical protein